MSSIAHAFHGIQLGSNAQNYDCKIPNKFFLCGNMVLTKITSVDF